MPVFTGGKEEKMRIVGLLLKSVVVCSLLALGYIMLDFLLFGTPVTSNIETGIGFFFGALLLVVFYEVGIIEVERN